MATKKSIDDYKDRMSSPIGAVRIDPKTGKVISSSSSKTRKSTSKKRTRR